MYQNGSRTFLSREIKQLDKSISAAKASDFGTRTKILWNTLAQASTIILAQEIGLFKKHFKSNFFSSIIEKISDFIRPLASKPKITT